MKNLALLKLGGSLITDKTIPYTPRLDKLTALAREIAAVFRTQPELALVIGHGSGSFGHTAAKEYKTREGTQTSLRLPPLAPPMGGEQEGGYWRGFAEVWYQASTLNRYVIQSLHDAGLAAMTFSPAASVWARDGKIVRWDVAQIQTALANGIIPVVPGDVIFDEAKGGTILSTEDLFEHLARTLGPSRILLAGLEGAVWTDFPARTQRVELITPASFNAIKAGVQGSHGADVTGGMESKVQQMLDLVVEIPGLTAQIFSGEADGYITRALSGENIGTMISV